MDEKKELKNFMQKKSREARGEADVEKKEEEDGLADRPRSVNQEAGEGDLRAAKALTTIRIVMNMLFIIPLALGIVALVGYILLKFLPSVLFFIKKFFIILLKSG